MSDFKRAERVAIEIQRALSDILRTVKDPRVVPLSITHVFVTDDLRLSRVRVVPMGGVGDSHKLLEGLRAASGFLSRKLAKKVRMKYAPRLEFHIDEQLDHAFSLVEQLESLIQEDSEEYSSEDSSQEE
ncbi:MAG: ribosome-binding factor A [Deltaproteobacteria bacterium]|nr:ribosome-binding factor A [Deltaproteobacteria bacterium]